MDFPIPNGQQSTANIKTLSYTDVLIGDVTIGSVKYFNISQFAPFNNVLFAQIKDYGQGVGALSIDTSGKYLSGDTGTVTGLRIRYFRYE